MLPEIVQVKPTVDYKVYVYFADGKVVKFDVEPLLQKEVFQPLRNIEFFLNMCTIMNNTLAWDISGRRDTTQCVDIDPYTLYQLADVEDK